MEEALLGLALWSVMGRMGDEEAWTLPSSRQKTFSGGSFLKSRKLLLAVGLVAAALLMVMPAIAASNGSIWFWGTGYVNPDCDNSDLGYSLKLTPNADDGGGFDDFAVVTVDAMGRPLDVDYWWWAPTSTTPFTDWDFTDMGLIYSIAYRPVTIALFDVPDVSGAPNENSVDGFNWVMANGTFMAEAVMDPAAVNALGCAGLPLLSEFRFSSPAPEPVILWPGDDRLNPHEGAPVAIYAVDGAYEIFSVDPGTSEGWPAFSFDIEGLEAGSAPFVVATGVNAFSGQPITVYLLPSEELQLNTYYADGKPYIVTWPLGSADPGELYIQAW